MTSRSLARLRITAVIVVALSFAGARHASAQAGAVLPPTHADTLIDAGRWSEAEEVLYAATRTAPRDPLARARLARYLAMKGALRPALVLIDEATQFGLPTSTARAVAAPMRRLLELRQRQTEGARDSSIVVREPSTPDGLLLMPIVRPGSRDTTWAELVPRMIGLDSASAPSARIGIEMLEGLVPEYDVANHMLRLHADSRSALSALGHRYAVLWTPNDVRVLLARGRVRSLPDALQELGAHCWQLDLLHGLLVVR